MIGPNDAVASGRGAYRSVGADLPASVPVTSERRILWLPYFSSAFSSEVADSTTTRTPWIVPVVAFLTASPAASLTS